MIQIASFLYGQMDTTRWTVSFNVFFLSLA